MAAMYYKLVLAHKRTCNTENKNVTKVPSTVFEEVLGMLIANGFDADGNKI